MTAVRISGTFKKDSRPDNGLEGIAPRLAKDEYARHVVVGVLELHKVTKEPGEAPVPTVRFIAIEPIEGGDNIDQAMVLLNNARKERGETSLAETLFSGNWPGAPTQLPGQMSIDDHEGATEGFADELQEMKKDLGVSPTRCVVCDEEIHFDPAIDGYKDNEGWTASKKNGAHDHRPAER